MRDQEGFPRRSKAHASGKRRVLAAETHRSWLDNIRHPETNGVLPDCLKLTDMMLQPKHFDHFEMSLAYREALEALAKSRTGEPRPQQEWHGIGPDDSLELTESGKEARLSRGQLEYHAAGGTRQKVALASNEAALVKLALAGGVERVGALPSIDGFAAIAVAAKLRRLGLLTVGGGVHGRMQSMQ